GFIPESRKRVTELFSQQLGPDVAVIKIAYPRDAEGLVIDDIDAKIAEFGDMKGQAFVCYYLGHGAIKAGTDLHYLNLGGIRPIPATQREARELTRTALLAKMATKNPELRILISDACATKDAEIVRTGLQLRGGGSAGAPPLPSGKVLNNLCRAYTGVVDINA